ncbi:hypothetical protein SLEP1_g25315 [Rubroshorea leprosula]|uniref:Uncharacterized protein n=1 Tax=Rubroshorea leprosula TaxID=152421 RepID=A0AAV5JS94_9ROSI|nr:hypothetical protein SLEP1_g25315 [Rubroshorea leprosula]
MWVIRLGWTHQEVLILLEAWTLDNLRRRSPKRVLGMSPFVSKPTMPSTPIKPAPQRSPLLNETPPSSSIVLKPPYPVWLYELLDFSCYLMF